MEECLEALQDKIACREREITTLYSLISSKTSMPQSIFTLGHSGTGKSLVIRSVLEYLNYDFAIVNCIENPTIKHLLQRIISDLWYNARNKIPVDDNKLFPKCHNVFEFIMQLKTFASQSNSNIVIVFENCSRLRDLDATFLASFLSLRRLCGVNVCSIFVSDVAFEKFKIKNELPEPIKIYFPQYTSREVTKILLLLAKTNNQDIDLEVYESYLDIFLQVYYNYCRDLQELHYMALLNFEKYMEPIKSGEKKKTDKPALYVHIRPIFTQNLEVIYLRIPPDQLHIRNSVTNNKIERERIELVKSFELPLYSKFLLLAGFLASYISPKLDKQKFSKSSKKTRRKKNLASNPKSLLTASPHSFSLDRMLCIFCYIYDGKVDINARFLSQISTLCRLGLLTSVGLTKLDEPKYKCCVDLDFIKVIAEMVGFEIQHFLTEL